MRLHKRVRLAAPLLALALTVGCSDAGDANGAGGGLPTLTDAGFYPLLTAQPASGDANVLTLSLKQVPGGIEVASVQGEIQYDAALLQLAGATLPEGVEGDAFEVSPGRVRFVGTLVQGAAETPLLRLEFRGREKPVTPAREMFSVRFEEVTGGAELADMTATVRSEHLLFVRGR
jgi:hypothetical protein